MADARPACACVVNCEGFIRLGQRCQELPVPDVAEVARNPVNLRCDRCSHVWTAAHTPMPLAAFAKTMTGLTCPACGAESKSLYLAPVQDLAMLDKLTRAICAETCAFYGDPPCYTIDGSFPPKSCDEPGCQAAAMAAQKVIEAGNG